MSQRLEHALALARLGFRIFPLLPGRKTPYPHEGWKAIMTTDEARIRRWFIERPDCNYAVCCDEHHIILDPDAGVDKKGRRKEGIENFRAIEDEDAEWPAVSIMDQTYRVRTPKGGIHLYFQAPRAYAISQSKVMPDVDVRGPDGYVVGPGCWTCDAPEENTAEGDYVVENDVPMAALPGWLEKRLDDAGLVAERAENANTAAIPLDLPDAVDTAKRVLRERTVAEQGKGGDAHTFATACQVKDHGISEPKCLELMLDDTVFEDGRSWNDHCDPPWGYDELARKVYNAYRYGNRQVGAKADALSAIGTCDAEESAMLAVGEHFSTIEQPDVKDEGEDRIENSLFWLHDFKKRDTEIDSLISEYVPGFGITGLLGIRGGGKSVCMVDFAMRIACDMDWHNTPIAKDWAVVYLCGEDDIGLNNQIRAWEIANGTTPADDRMVVATEVPDLMNGFGVKQWATALKKRFKDRRVVLFVDTWQRATSMADQNDNKEMQSAFHNAEGLARYLDGCAIVACHPPKGRDDTISGSAVIENSTVSILTITDGMNSKRLEVTRIKGRGKGNFVTFKIDEIKLGGNDKLGKPITGVVSKVIGGTEIGVTNEQEKSLEALRYEVVRLIEDVLIERKGKGVTFKDTAQIVLSTCQRDPHGKLSKAFGNPRHVEDVVGLMPELFNASTLVTLDSLATVGVEAGKFILRGNGIE